MNYMENGSGSEIKVKPSSTQLAALLERSLHARLADPALTRTQAYRIFNGFYEGFSGLVVDQFDSTIVISNHHKQPDSIKPAVETTIECFRKQARSILVKTRHSPDPQARKGIIVHGSSLCDQIEENGTQYSLDLQLNQDNSFYLDTRDLRTWLKENSQERSVLNCFAYTGSLGIAAFAGGAKAVLQTDLNAAALALAEASYELNSFSDKMNLLIRDFFSAVNHLKQQKLLFDLVILDSPFFSSTRFGRVDLQKQQSNLINKVRPLVGHAGKLVLINNALFVSGKQYMQSIEKLQASGYLEFDKTIPIPEDITGYPDTKVDQPPVNPNPFNHPTKIVVLDVRRKDGQVGNYV